MKMKKFLALVLSMCMIFSMSAVVFAEGDGTEENPEVLTEMTGDTVTVSGGDDIAYYYYSYTVPADVEGIVMYNFSVTEPDEYFIMNVDNTTSGAYAQMVKWAWSDTVTTGSVKAKAGDVLSIRVQTVNNAGVYETVTVDWSATMMSVGTADSPEVIDTMFQMGSYSWNGSTIVATDGSAYYYKYVVEKTGTLNIYIDEQNSTDYWYVQYPEYYDDDPAIPNSMTELAAEIVVKNGDNVVKYSDGTTNVSISTGYGSASYDVIQMEVTEGDEITIEVSSEAEGYESVAIVFGAIISEPTGSQGNPIAIQQNNQEFTIPAGATYFVSIENYTLQQYPVSITGGDAVVFDYYGEELEGQTGIVVEPVYDPMTYTTYCMLQIKNDSAEDVTYTITVELPLGLESNPEVLDTNDSVEHTFEVDDYAYYYYKWTAEADGIVYFEVTSDADWRYSVDNMTTQVWGSYVNSVDEDIKHIVIDVKQGDVLSVYVSAMNYDTYEVVTETTVTTTVEFVASEGVMDAEDVSDIITDLWSDEYEEAGTIVLNNIGTVIPYALLDELLTYNTDYELNVGITLVTDVYTWILENIESSTSVDLGIEFDTDNVAETIIEAVANGNEYITFSIAHDGAFGFDAVLQFAVDSSYAGKTVALYWNNNGTLELVGEKCVVAEDGAVEFDMTHASDYVLVVEGTATEVPPTEVPPTEVPPTEVEPPKTADMAPIAMIIAIAAVAAVVVLKKRTVEE